MTTLLTTTINPATLEGAWSTTTTTTRNPHLGTTIVSITTVDTATMTQSSGNSSTTPPRPTTTLTTTVPPSLPSTTAAPTPALDKAEQYKNCLQFNLIGVVLPADVFTAEKKCAKEVYGDENYNVPASLQLGPQESRFSTRVR